MFILEMPPVTLSAAGIPPKLPAAGVSAKPLIAQTPPPSTDGFTAAPAFNPGELRRTNQGNYATLIKGLVDAITKGNIEQAALIRNRMINFQNSYNDVRVQAGFPQERIVLSEEDAKKYAQSLGQLAQSNGELINSIPTNLNNPQKLKEITEQLEINKQLGNIYREALGLPQQQGLELTPQTRALYRTSIQKFSNLIAGEESQLFKMQVLKDSDQYAQINLRLNMYKTLLRMANDFLPMHKE